MSQLIKSSKKLNKLFDELTELDNSEDCIFGNLASTADMACIEQSNDYRATDYAEYVEGGIAMAQRAMANNTPIYCVYSENIKECILYFVRSEADIKKILEDLIQVVKDNNEECFEIATKEEIELLEKKLIKLKSKKKK